MAITTVDGLIAGTKPTEFFMKNVSGTLVAGRAFSYFYTAGIPGAAVASTAGLSGEALTSYPGQIPVPAAVGSTNIHLVKFSAQLLQPGVLYLCDRLWHNSGITITSNSPQTINSVTFPARDKNGSTNGDGVFLGVEVTSNTGAGTPTLTATYTNSSGTASRTGTNTKATVASSLLGTFHHISLNSNDVGVRSVQSFQLSATWTSGSISLVAYRILATIEILAAGYPNATDCFSTGLPRIYDNSVPFLIFVPQTTTTTGVNGSVVFTQG